MKTFKLDGNIATFDYDGEFGKWIGPKSVANWLHSLKDGEEAEIEMFVHGPDAATMSVPFCCCMVKAGCMMLTEGREAERDADIFGCW